MKKYSLFLYFSLLLQNFSIAESKISGQIPKFSEKAITVYKYKNHFSNDLEKVTTAKIDQQGNFQFNILLDTADYYRIEIGRKNLYCFLEKQGKYEIGLIKNKLKVVYEAPFPINQKMAIYENKLVAIAEKRNKKSKKNHLKGYEELQLLKVELTTEQNGYFRQLVQSKILLWEIHYLMFGGVVHGNKRLTKIDMKKCFNLKPKINTIGISFMMEKTVS